MPRKTPARIRVAAARSHRAVDGMGALPGPVWNALVRLERADLDPEEVAWAVIHWRRIAWVLIRGTAPPYSADVEFSGPHARDLLEVAISALDGRARRQLTQLVRDLDDRIQSHTINDPQKPAGPWWHRILAVE